MKRLWTNILIFFGCFLLLVTTIGAVLIIAPGMELLGIMYIRNTSGTVEARESIPDAITYDKITVESDNIPVTIKFIQSYSLNVKFIEKYDGFAKAGPEPYMKVTVIGSEVKIESFEYKPFIGYSRDKESGLFVEVPMYYTNDIEVNSNKSKVHFVGQKATVGNVTINAKGEVILANDLSLKTLNLNFGNKDATIADSVVMSGRVIATSTRGDLTLPVGFSGMVEYRSSTGDLKCAGCGQLKFTSKMGKVKGTTAGLPIINGDVEINTGGSVTIDRIAGSASIYTKNGKVSLGSEGQTYTNRLNVNTKSGSITMTGNYTNEENKITSKYGKIVLDHITNGTITTNYGKVSIKYLKDGNVASKSGDVEVNKIESSTIETKSGDVKIGDVEKYDSSASIKTKSGEIAVENVGDGLFDLTTNSGDVTFTQNTEGKSEIVIQSTKGDVELVNITGKTSVNTSGKINASIYNINDTIKLVGKNKKVNVSVRNNCYLDLTSKKNIETAPNVEGKTKSFSNVPDGETKYIKIETNKGKISVLVSV